MSDKQELEREIIIMQDHLQSLRKLAGWTSEELGKKLGITKQAVSALENKSSKLKQMHYLALIYLFETESEKNPENTTLKEVLELLFSDPDNYEEKKVEIDKNITELAAALGGGGTSEKTASLLTKNLITPLLPIAAAVASGVAIGVAIPIWKKKISNLGKKK